MFPKRAFVFLCCTVLLLSFATVNAGFAQDASQVEQLYTKAKRYQDQALYDSALYYFEITEKLARQQKDWQGVMMCLYGVGGIRSDQGKYEDAEKRLLKALKISQQHFPEHIYETGEAYYILAYNYSQKADYPAALTHYQKAIAIYKKIQGDQHVSVANTYAAIGAIYNNLDHSNELAIQSFLKGNDILKEIGKSESIEMARNYNDLANTYQDLEQYDLALDYHHQSLKIKENVLRENHPELAVSYFNLAQVSLSKGDLDAAIAHYQNALEVDISNFGHDHRWVAEDYFNLAHCYNVKGSYDKAIRYAHKAYDMLKANYGENNLRVAESLYALGDAYYYTGDFSAAQNAYLKAVATFKELAERYQAQDALNGQALVLNSLGKVMRERQDYDASINYHQQALRLHLVMQNTKRASVGDTQLLLAQAHLENQNYDQAEKLLKEAHANLAQSLGDKHPAVADAYRLLGDVNMQLGEYDKALKYYQHSLACLTADYNIKLIEKLPPKEGIHLTPALITTLRYKALSLRKRFGKTQNAEDLHLALSHLDFASAMVDSMRVLYLQDGSNRNPLQDHLPVYEDALSILYDLHRIDQDKKWVEAAFSMMEQSKALQLLSALREADARNFAAVPDAILQQEKQMMLDLSYYENMTRRADSAQQEWRSKAFSIKQSYDSLIRKIAADYPEYHALKYKAEVMSLSQVQEEMLRPDEAMLTYLQGDSNIYKITLTQESAKLEKIPNTHQLQDALDMVRSAITEKRSIDQFASPAHKVYSKLIMPSEALLQHKKLIIIPDGKLSYLPFEVLLKEKVVQGAGYRTLPYLVREHQLNYQFSATLMQMQREQKMENKAVSYLAFAPEFNQVTPLLASADKNPLQIEDTVRGTLAELRGTVREVKAIGRWMEGNYYEGRDADEATFKREASKYQVLHLATHAIVDDQYPMNSRLLFTPSASTEEDGNLYAWELYGLKLDAKMVVLSACNTGYGKIQRGEGVMSLGRAFAYAGCPSVVMSLWPAQDRATADLMEAFYEEIAGGHDKDVAMQNAKLRYLGEANELFAHPFYWAGFIVQGNTQPLENHSSWINYIWIGSVLIILLFSLLAVKKIFFQR
ncbi:CHAT domain-containing protein [Catalinimonas alkaloidigena]|uniref:CHAT domain-containing protein n=1 Tax=Catalinimonas alkaloidigena TaxID=1075417 RepID=UPI0024059D8C|nr:CHAT domain-containing protein [Catalinimonas alkaloidigena]MDF9795014.1 CHAT domain-containing protein [Catalinimonas alkaloidigena]